MIWLPDTDTTNYLIKLREPVWSRYMAAIEAGDSFAHSSVVRYEATRHLTLKNATRVRSDFDRLIHLWTPICLDSTDWDTAANLWADRHRVGRPIEDADLL